MKTFILLLAIFFINLNSLAQTADWIFNPEISREGPSGWNKMADFKNMLTDVGTGDIYSLVSLQDTVWYENKEYISKSSSIDLLIIKLNAAGEIQWTKQLGGVRDDYGSTIAFYNNELIISMHFTDSTLIGSKKFYDREGKVLLINMNKSDGSVTDTKQFNINGSITSVFTTQDNEIYLAGLFSINSSIGPFDLPDPYIIDIWGNKRATRYIYVAKLGPDKQPLWVRHSVHRSCCVAPQVTNFKVNPVNGDIIIIGHSAGPVGFEGNFISGAGFYHSYIVSYDSNGNFKWYNKAESIYKSGLPSIIFTDLDFDTKGHIYVTGHYTDEARIGEFILNDENGSGYQNGFVTKLIPSGDYIWAKAILGGKSTFTTAIICKGDDCYFGGSYRRYLKFDSVQVVVPSTDSELYLSNGYIGKIEDGNNLNKLLIIESSGTAGVNGLNDHTTRFILGTGFFSNDISMGCLSKSGDRYTPYGARINLTNEISAPEISGPANTCADDLYYLTISNYDPNNRYQIITSENVTVSSHVGELVELAISPDAPDTINLYALAVNKCNWRAVSKNHTIVRKRVPKLSGPIQNPGLLCEGNENIILSVSPNDSVDLYHWTLPQGLSVDGQTQVISDSNEITVTAFQSVDSETIEVYGSHVCGNTDTIPLNVSVISKLPQPEITGDRLICNDGIETYFTTTLKGNLVGSLSYHWQISEDLFFKENKQQKLSTSYETVSVEVKNKVKKGEQWIKVSVENECFSSDILSVKLTASELAENPEISVAKCDRLIETNLAENFEWIFNGVPLSEEISSLINKPDSGYYQIRSYSLCDSKLSEQVYVNPLILENLIIPNIITPNGDDANEVFIIDERLQGSYLTVYNRWGGIIYENDNYSNEWNGKETIGGPYFYGIKHHCLTTHLKGSLFVFK